MTEISDEILNQNLKTLIRDKDKIIKLSDGEINTENLDKAIKITQKIDISSALEDNPGKKSVKKVSDFLLEVKKFL